jgi:hypothetical protein
MYHIWNGARNDTITDVLNKAYGFFRIYTFGGEGGDDTSRSATYYDYIDVHFCLLSSRLLLLVSRRGL